MDIRDYKIHGYMSSLEIAKITDIAHAEVIDDFMDEPSDNSEVLYMGDDVVKVMKIYIKSHLAIKYIYKHQERPEYFKELYS